MDSSKQPETLSCEIPNKENSNKKKEGEEALEHVEKNKEDFPDQTSECKFSDVLSSAENDRKTETDIEAEGLKLKTETNDMKKPQDSDQVKLEKDYSEVKVELIDIPEDEDLFDFLDKSRSDKVFSVFANGGDICLNMLNSLAEDKI